MIFPRCLQYLGWLGALIGLLMIFLGGLSFLIDEVILNVRNFYNWFVIAPSFFLLAMSCFLGVLTLQKKQEPKSE
jgi:hypothetical protein